MIEKTPRGLRLALGAALAFALGGCVTLLPKTQPSQMYRFDVQPAEPTPQGAGDGESFQVHRATTSFARGADGDQILTINGDQAAYIAGARWIAPASALFDDAESRAFDTAGGPAHLGRRGEMGQAPVSLRLDVEAFEARYLEGVAAAPTVVVQVRASLERTLDRKVIATRMFESRKKAASNNVSAIVPEYDHALTETLGQIVSWTDTEGAAAAKSAG